MAGRIVRGNIAGKQPLANRHSRATIAAEERKESILAARRPACDYISLLAEYRGALDYGQ